MNRLILFAVTIFFFMQILACSSTKKYYPVGNHAARISTLGFSIVPPPGRNWFERSSEKTISYFKRSGSKTYSITAKATELIFAKNDPGERVLLKYAETNNIISAKKGNQFRNSVAHYTIEKLFPALCVRYQQNYEDYRDAGKGQYPFVKVVNNRRICQHPEWPGRGLELSYLEKSIPQVKNPSYRNEGESFLNSLRFISPTDD